MNEIFKAIVYSSYFIVSVCSTQAKKTMQAAYIHLVDHFAFEKYRNEMQYVNFQMGQSNVF